MVTLSSRRIYVASFSKSSTLNPVTLLTELGEQLSYWQRISFPP